MQRNTEFGLFTKPSSMVINIHPHARQRMIERCVKEDEVYATIAGGEIFPVKIVCLLSHTPKGMMLFAS
ncbi:MAG: DUF4258 domain-containing protein [Desulfobacteraceae bacterium]|nr:DUF4258 domain-containing protein [Desulfobacteraceae bacterium]